MPVFCLLPYPASFLYLTFLILIYFYVTVFPFSPHILLSFDTTFTHTPLRSQITLYHPNSSSCVAAPHLRASPPGSRLRPKTLQVVDVPILDSRLCEDWHRQKGINVIIYDEMMCAGWVCEVVCVFVNEEGKNRIRSRTKTRARGNVLIKRKRRSSKMKK